MLEIRDKQIQIDGVPQLLISGEIHYFRLPKSAWQRRIDHLKATGANAVASYIPWLCHELGAGEYDFTGRTREERDLVSFIELSAANDLWFIARPGPFVMAELKNEGLPYRLYDEHPEIAPVTWDGHDVPTRTVDYLTLAFLAEAKRWYAGVGEALAPHMQPTGGNVIAVQLDNEIGMLSWVSNSPDLTDALLADLWSWLERRYPPDELARRYPAERFGPGSRIEAFRTPDERDALQTMRDLGHYMRGRFARYVAELRVYAEAAGMGSVPFVVNVHGTADGDGAPFPIGISQLAESYTQAAGYLSGSDIYLGDLTLTSATDLYVLNGFMDAAHRPEQPIASVEFECGDGDYGGQRARRIDPSAADLKLRICIAQGARLVNLYLFTGGFNWRLDELPGDGNDRISFTGERHGVAAPVGPEGALNSTYPRLARSIQGLTAVAEKLAVATEEHDPIALGFIPDYYMTESHHPGSARMTELVENVTRSRGTGPGGVLARAMLLNGLRFGAVDLQRTDPDPATVLALGSARFMDGGVQRRLVEFLESGGRLLLHGELPVVDMLGEPCTILADALGLTPVGKLTSTHRFHLSLESLGWAAPRAEMRAGWAQTFPAGSAGAFLRVYGQNDAVGVERAVGNGRVVLIAAEIPCDLALFRTALARLGVEPALAHGHPDDGIVLTSARTPAGERFIHLINLDGFDKHVRLTDHGTDLLGRELNLRGRDGLMLPFGVQLHGVTIISSTAEIAGVNTDEIRFRVTLREETIALETVRAIEPSDDYDAIRHDAWTTIHSRIAPPTSVDEHVELAIRFAES